MSDNNIFFSYACLRIAVLIMIIFALNRIFLATLGEKIFYLKIKLNFKFLIF